MIIAVNFQFKQLESFHIHYINNLLLGSLHSLYSGFQKGPKIDQEFNEISGDESSLELMNSLLTDSTT